MITLYGSGFSPFSRKIQMVLEYKSLDYDFIEIENENSVKAFDDINPRKEVPVLIDGDNIVINSSDIAAYLDHQYLVNPVLPRKPSERVVARKWERISDTLLDAITVDLLIWSWANLGPRPKGLFEAAKNDLEGVYYELEVALENKQYVSGSLSIADIALFPHLGAVKLLGIPFSKEAHPNIYAWYKNMRSLQFCQADLDRIKGWLATVHERPLEKNKIAWRGDRLEWLMAKGFHEWFYTQIAQEKVIWPI